MGIFQQHSTLRRLPGLLAVLAYLGAWGGDVLALSDCPQHDGKIVSGLTAPELDPGVDRGVEGGHEHGNAHGPQSHEGDHDHGPCDCIGDCVGASAASTPVRGSAQLAPVASSEPVDLAPASDLLARIHLPFVLPYATAPPSVAIRTHI